MAEKVVILGGGVAGMTAAHELIERGFQVEVYDLGDLPGGKAKSMYHGAAVGPNGRLPAEHGFRFFPGWYQHVDDTMKRTPYPWGASAATVFDNLTEVAEVGFASEHHAPILMLSRFPRSLHELAQAIDQLFSPQVQFGPGEIEFYARKLWQILTTCHPRRLAEYEKIGWWEFIDADSKSENYRKYLANLPRTLVAADPHTVSTKTNGDILLQMFLDIGRPETAADRVLKGPTNEMWLFAWLKYLIDQGVHYYVNAEVTEILTDATQVTGATVVATRDPINDTGEPDPDYRMARVLAVDRYGIIDRDVADPQERTVTGDYYVAAMPVEAFAKLVGTANTAPTCSTASNATGLVKLDPTLSSVHELAETSVDWMSGMLLYLRTGAPSLAGHMIYVDPPIALTSVFQKQYWPDIDMSQYGDGQVADILSMDISDWTKCEGALGRTLDRYPDRATVQGEVWEDVKKSFVNAPQPFTDADRHDGFLDPAIQPVAAPEPDGPTLLNRTPLLVNKVNTWSLRPQAHTRIPNFFLASDYVRTNTDLATMEGANEAARRAVNALLDRAGSSAGLCRIFELHEPEMLALFRWYDQRRFARGLPYRDVLPAWLHVLHRADVLFRGAFTWGVQKLKAPF